jgi:hypothetical protein
VKSKKIKSSKKPVLISINYPDGKARQFSFVSLTITTDERTSSLNKEDNEVVVSIYGTLTL